MVGPREGPDVAFELRQKLNQNLIGRLRNEVALRHFEFVARQRSCAGQETGSARLPPAPENRNRAIRRRGEYRGRCVEVSNPCTRE